jgi:hypothetical protein
VSNEGYAEEWRLDTNLAFFALELWSWDLKLEDDPSVDFHVLLIRLHDYRV